MSSKTADLLASLPRHPQDDKIAYCPDDPSIYVPFVRNGFLRAAIIPCPDRQSFDKAASDAALDLMDLYKYNMSFPSMDIAPLYPLQFDRFGRLYNDIYSKTDITDQVDPVIINGLQRCFNAVAYDSAATTADIMVLASPEQSGRHGINPRFHEDHDIIAYMSFFGGHFEYMTGDITPDVKKILSAQGRATREDMEEDAPVLRGRIHTLDHGDMIYFAHTLMHRSSPHIPQKGQLAFTL